MNHTVSCIAPPQGPFSPLYLLFHVSRYRPRMLNYHFLLICRQRAIFSTTLWIHTNLTSVPIDLIVYDGLLSAYVSNDVLTSPLLSQARITYSIIDGETINWGTRLTPVLSATSLLTLNLDMGYLHPGDHRYQTLVLYNRNPVSVSATIRSPNLPYVHFYPIFRAQLSNQTLSDLSLPNCKDK